MAITSIQPATSVQPMFELWSSSLRDVKARIEPLFSQKRVAGSAGQFLDGLFGNEPRKTGWMRAEAAGDRGPWRQQAILGRGHWDADGLRDIVCDYALETLADADAILVLDETGFLKQGKASCGVARQYMPSAGKIANCQIGVFASYVSRHGHAFIDRTLFLPREWTDDPVRMKAAHVPPHVSFTAKPRIALAMITRALAAKVPFSFVAANDVFGNCEVETELRKAGKGFVLGIAGNHLFDCLAKGPYAHASAAKIARKIPKRDFKRLPAGAGAGEPRLYDWAYIELADFAPGQYGGAHEGIWTQGLLVRRTIADGEFAFFSTWCPKGTVVEKLVSVEGHRQSIEDSFKTAKKELGLDHNETRSWHGWHRHVSLVMLAFAMTAAIRRQANAVQPREGLTAAPESLFRPDAKNPASPRWESAYPGR